MYLWTQTFLFLWLWMWYVKLLIMWLIILFNSVHVFKSGDSNFLFSFSIILMRKAALMYSDRNIQNNMVVLDFACLSSVCMYSTFIQFWINKCFQCKLNLHLFSMFIVNKKDTVYSLYWFLYINLKEHWLTAKDVTYFL